MAKQKQQEKKQVKIEELDETAKSKVDDAIDFSSELIKELNKEMGQRVSYNLTTDDAPTNIKRWISFKSRLLDYIVSNKKNGGAPEGRIIEIYGPPSIGKSHLAHSLAVSTQKMGGLVVYIDTENATSVERLAAVGIDVTKRFVFCEEHCTENVFKIIESTITKAKAISNKNIPILVVWDSVAATSPKQELDGEYDDNTIGLQARVLSKGLRKITGVIGENNVTMVCINQTRSKVGFVMGDPTTTPGGVALPFHSSVRIGLTGGSLIKTPGGVVIGINVNATIKKNKVARPYRKASFEIHFGKGIVESSDIYELLKKRSDITDSPITNGEFIYSVSGGGAWKLFTVANKDGEVIIEKKFQKASIDDLFNDEEVGKHLEDMLEIVMTSDSIDVTADE